jgi:hypothetical protein
MDLKETGCGSDDWTGISGGARSFKSYVPDVNMEHILKHSTPDTFHTLNKIYINKNVNVRLFKILNLLKFFTDCFEILTQRCIRIRACFYVHILYRCHTCDR